MEKSKTQARRLLLRTMVLGGSATAATKLIPETWVKPVVNSVITPVHAQMSTGMDDDGGTGMPTGFFQTDQTLFGGIEADQQQQIIEPLSEKASVLDYFIKPANAGDSVRPETCDVVAIVNVSFNIPNNPGSVDICSNGSTGSSTVSGTSITDFSIDDYDFVNVSVSETEVAGDVQFFQHGLSQVQCTQAFSAPLVDGVFSCDVVEK